MLTCIFSDDAILHRRHFVVSITYECFDGAPLMSKSVSLAYSPLAAMATVAAPAVPQPQPHPEQVVFGWQVFGGELSLHDVDNACFNNTLNAAQNGTAQAVYSELGTSVSATAAGWGILGTGTTTGILLRRGAASKTSHTISHRLNHSNTHGNIEISRSRSNSSGSRNSRYNKGTVAALARKEAAAAVAEGGSLQQRGSETHGGIVIGLSSTASGTSPPTAPITLNDLDYWLQWSFSDDGQVYVKG